MTFHDNSESGESPCPTTSLDDAGERSARVRRHRTRTARLPWVRRICGGGRNDGSLVDFFRYMIDAADMDFGAITDHNSGGDNEYWWWYINKLTDVAE